MPARQVRYWFVSVVGFVFFGFGDVGVSTGITKALGQNFGDGLSIALAFVRQRELNPPVEAGSL